MDFVLCSLSRFIRTFLLFSVAIFFSTQLFAGDVLRFSGLVTDPTGSLVPNAKITAQNTGTGLRQTIESDNEGAY